MKIDEALKDIFEESGIDDFVKAYAFLHNSGCYTRFECINNASYYFDREKDVNSYHVIKEFGRDLDKLSNVKFYKLNVGPHIEDYISFCISNEFEIEQEMHEEAYVVVSEIVDIHPNDILYIIKNHIGYHICEKETVSITLEGDDIMEDNIRNIRNRINRMTDADSAFHASEF